MNSFVSVIITTYNREFEILERAIKSVLNQTYTFFEIIVIEDCGDKKYNIANKIKKYPNINYYRNSINSGVSVARNIGIELAKGEYVSFLDDDDEWLQNKLEKEIALLDKTNNSVGMVYSNYYKCFDNKNKKIANKQFIVNGDGLTPLLEKGNYIMFPIIKKECFTNVGYYDPDILRSEDYEMYLRILKKYKIIYNEAILSIYHINGTNKSSNKMEFIKANIIIEKKHNALLNKYPLGRYNVLLSRSKAYAKTGNSKLSLNTFFTAIKYSNIGQIKTSVFTLAYIILILIKNKYKLYSQKNIY